MGHPELFWLVDGGQGQRQRQRQRLGQQQILFEDDNKKGKDNSNGKDSGKGKDNSESGEAGLAAFQVFEETVDLVFAVESG